MSHILHSHFRLEKDLLSSCPVSDFFIMWEEITLISGGASNSSSFKMATITSLPIGMRIREVNICEMFKLALRKQLAQCRTAGKCLLNCVI